MKGVMWPANAICGLLMLIIPQISVADKDQDICVENNSTTDELKVQFLRKDNDNTAYLTVEPGKSGCTAYPINITSGSAVYCTANASNTYYINSIPARLTCTTTVENEDCQINCSSK